MKEDCVLPPMEVSHKYEGGLRPASDGGEPES